MKNLFFILTFAAVLSACSSTECIGGACADVDTTIRFKPTDNDYVAQNKKQTYVSPKGSSTKKPTVAKKDTVVVVQKIVVVKEVPKKEVAPTPKPKVVKKPKAVVKTEPTDIQIDQIPADFNGSKPYNPILFK
jgi:hypothetical protein